MLRLAYLAMLAFCLVATLPLELWLGVRVWRRPLRLLLTVAPVAAAFLAWDAYAVSRGHWDFDPAQTTGVVLPPGLPLEEVLFFVVVPVCAVLTLEAVRSVRGWPVGDEPVGDEPLGDEPLGDEPAREAP